MAEHIDRGKLIDDVERVCCSGCDSYNGVRCRACNGEGDNLPCVGCLLEEICGDELPEDAVEFEIQEDA